MTVFFSVKVRACLHVGGGPQIGEVICGGSPHLSCKRDQIKMRDYMDRWVTPPKRVTSPTCGPPPPCKQALRSKSSIHTSRWNNGRPCPFCRGVFPNLVPRVLSYPSLRVGEREPGNEVGVSPSPAISLTPLRESVIPVTKFVSPQAEIDIFEAMDVNPHTVGLQKVQGLEGEFGDAYKIEKNISRMELPSSYLEQMRFLLNNKRRMVIMANVKVMNNSRGTLFSLERRRKGMAVWQI